MFYFESPDLLYLLAIAPILQLILLWAYWRWRRRTLRRLGSPALEERLLKGFSPWRFWAKNIMFGLAIVLVIVAIASPVTIRKVAGTEQKSADVILAMDISNSMLAQDVPPSRLEVVKQFIRRLAPVLDGEQVGLVCFAGEAFPQMPLSTDLEAMLMFAENAQPDFITDQGTDIGAAVELAARMLETDVPGGRAIILFSDGENHEEKAAQKVREANAAGITLYTVGVGNAGSVPIPDPSKGLRKDGMGKTVQTTANETLLRTLAQAGGGEALHLRNPEQALSILKQAIESLEKRTVSLQTKSEKVYWFHWFLLAAIVLLITEQIMWWKKKTVGILVLLLAAMGVSAQDEHQLLRQGQQHYDKGEFEKAQSVYMRSGTVTGKYNAANAAYLNQDLDLSVKLYQEAAERSVINQQKADALYNLGNACLLLSDYRAAIDAYERSLRLMPAQPDAQKNLQIAKRKLSPDPPPPPQPPPPPPPPPSNRPRQQYLDQAQAGRKPDIPPANLSAAQARALLDQAVQAAEEKNAGAYRELAPANRPSRLKKDW